jgi:hypothetical protein
MARTSGVEPGGLASNLLFYAFFVLTAGSAFVVAQSRNIMHSAFALMLTFFGVAGTYAFLGADFLAAAQLVIYVGGILVFIVFASIVSLPTRRCRAFAGPGRGYPRATRPRRAGPPARSAGSSSADICSPSSWSPSSFWPRWWAPPSLPAASRRSSWRARRAANRRGPDAPDSRPFVPSEALTSRKTPGNP